MRGTLIPTFRFDSTYLSTLVAILGTTISPYLFFWQANQEVEEQKSKRNHRGGKVKTATSGELPDAVWDVNTGMLLSNVVMYFIILATAATLHGAGKHEIHTAAQAAEALRPIAGTAAYVLMALGLVGAGVLAVPILTGSAAYSVAELFDWKYGLDQKPHLAKVSTASSPSQPSSRCSSTSSASTRSLHSSGPPSSTASSRRRCWSSSCWSPTTKK